MRAGNKTSRKCCSSSMCQGQPVDPFESASLAKRSHPQKGVKTPIRVSQSIKPTQSVDCFQATMILACSRDCQMKQH